MLIDIQTEIINYYKNAAPKAQLFFATLPTKLDYGVL